MKSARTRQIRLARERWQHVLNRKGKTYLPVAKNSQAQPGLHFAYRSSILDSFYPEFVPFERRNHLDFGTFTLPAKFSLMRNAEETLRVVESIVRYSRTAKVPRIVIDHRSVKEVGLAADSVLGVVLKEIMLELQFVEGFFLRGYKSTNPAVIKMSDEIGCIRILNAGVDEDIRVSLNPSAHVYRHRNRFENQKTNPFTGDVTSSITTEFSDHLDSCLELVKKKLSPGGKDRLLGYVAEVLINAHEHSGKHEWTIVGFIDKEDRDLVYRCAIFSLGKTMADTFTELPSDSYAWKLVEPYLLLHEKAGFFQAAWRREDLIAVVALQGHISSKSTLDNDRGQGTVDLIEFFQSMANECSSKGKKPKMMVFSGGTQILFDGKYAMQFELDANRSIIAFNSENSLLKRPDPDAVRCLPNVRFPGTLISIAVPLADGAVEDIEVENGN